jgi:5'/3'-nucleotidase SurE
VISGINAGANCGYEMFHSSAIAAAREALLYDVPSIAISLNWWVCLNGVILVFQICFIIR